MSAMYTAIFSIIGAAATDARTGQIARHKDKTRLGVTMEADELAQEEAKAVCKNSD